MDLKKLISGFLVLAATVSSFALVLPNLLSSREPQQIGDSSISQYSNTPAADSPPPIPPNAFIEPLPETKPAAATAQPNLASDSDPLQITPTDNLTESLGKQIAKELIESNPEGPLALGGEKLFVLPSEEKFDSMLKESIKNNNLAAALPDFDSQISDTSFKILSNASKDDGIKYLKSIDDVLGATLVNENFDKLLAKEPSLEALASAQLVYEEATKKLSEVSVPKELLPFHKSLFVLISDQKKFIDVPANYSDDPVLTMIAVNAARGKIDAILARDAANFRKELDDLNNKFLSLRGTTHSSLAAQILRIKTAHALIFGFAVPIEFAGPIAIANKVATWGNWMHRIYEWVQGFLKSLIQNQLLGIIQRQIVGWIQGGGKPKFITNWKDFLGDVFNEAAGAAIEKIAPKLCQNIGPLVRINLKYSYNTPEFGSYCTLDRVVRNIQNFFEDFSRGGFVAYGAAALPTNNYYGSIWFASQDVSEKAKEAKEAAKNTGLAGGGFLGTLVCKDGSEAQRGKCRDGSTPDIRTPGQTAGAALSKALGSSVDRIVNADRLENLVAAIVDSAINRLIRAGLSGISGVFTSNPPGLGSPYSGVSNSSQPPPPGAQLPPPTATSSSPSQPPQGPGISPPPQGPGI